jgi:hypothetical protein
LISLTPESHLHGGLIPVTVDCYHHLFMFFTANLHFTALNLDLKSASSGRVMRLAGRGRLFSVRFGFGHPTFMAAVTADARQMVEPKRDGLFTALKRRKIFSLLALYPERAR